MSSRNDQPDFDPRERYALYRLCDCTTCGGSGKVESDTALKDWTATSSLWKRCPNCRGEGRIRQEVATCESPEAVGVALVTLAREGEFSECQFGLLDRGGEVNAKWLVLPWPATARTVSAAGKLLRASQRP